MRPLAARGVILLGILLVAPSVAFVLGAVLASAGTITDAIGRALIVATGGLLDLGGAFLLAIPGTFLLGAGIVGLARARRHAEDEPAAR